MKDCIKGYVLLLLVIFIFLLPAIPDLFVTRADIGSTEANGTIVFDGEQVTDATVEWNDEWAITVRKSEPTHICAVHGELGGDSWSVDFLTITVDEIDIYHGCANCTMEYLAGHLKKHIPPLTKIEKETK